MKKTMLLLALFTTPLWAQPRIIHGTVTPVRASGDLGSQIRASRTRWIGYEVPQVGGFREMCCFSNYGNVHYGGTCRLGSEGSYFTNREDEGPAADKFAVLYRVTDGSVESVRSYSLDCAVDANGEAITWIEDVNPRVSADFLASLVGSDRAGKRALGALALHADVRAAEALDTFVRSSSAPDEVRGEAIFWMAETRGLRALEPARALLRDTSATEHVREKAVFALSLIDDLAAVDELIRIARNDSRSATRGKALFWLSQKAGRKAADALRDAVDNDPEADVRAKAVFGISQLPNDESIPLLIDLMKHHKSAEVRKKAAFWLGQKNDPRALAAIEELLKQ